MLHNPLSYIHRKLQGRTLLRISDDTRRLALDYITPIIRSRDPDEMIGEGYMARWHLLRSPRGNIYVHEFTGPDEVRHLHDHPWEFTSIVLDGGYVEVFRKQPNGGPIQTRLLSTVRCVGDVINADAETAHRIVDTCGDRVLTLVFTGPRDRDWGFYTEEGFVPSQAYLRRRGIG